MNAWKFNSTAQSFLLLSTARFFNIYTSNVYKHIKNISVKYNEECYIETQDGKKYKITFEEIK